MDVGVLGLGHMGLGMAMSLLRKGHRVRVWNRSPERAHPLVDQGATAVATPEEAFAGDAAVTMLADDRAVRETVLDRGLLKRAAGGRFVHLSCSTISVQFAQELEAAHTAAGVGFVSAPVLGRPDMAEQGHLNVLAAGDPAMIERADPLLKSIGKAVWPIGERPHQANAVKLSLNFSLAAAIETMGEAFALSHAWGVEPARVAEIMTSTVFNCPAYTTYSRLIVDERFEPAGFAAPLGLKDVREALKAAEAKGVPLPFGEIMRDHLTEIVDGGGEAWDWSALGAWAARKAAR